MWSISPVTVGWCSHYEWVESPIKKKGTNDLENGCFNRRLCNENEDNLLWTDGHETELVAIWPVQAKKKWREIRSVRATCVCPLWQFSDNQQMAWSCLFSSYTLELVPYGFPYEAVLPAFCGGNDGLGNDVWIFRFSLLRGHAGREVVKISCELTTWAFRWKARSIRFSVTSWVLHFWNLSEHKVAEQWRRSCICLITDKKFRFCFNLFSRIS